MSAGAGTVAAIAGLNDVEIRVLGCLLEKQRTTPDAYPLSLNALRLACNQSTNRDPVVEYDEAGIREALDRLQRRGLTRLASGAGSRAAKFRHLLAEALPMDGGEQAILCVLMLRGPQTPGELKQRGERMHPFADLGEVLATLERLSGRELVRRLQRRPGQKEERYAHLLGEQGDPARSDDAAARYDAPADGERAGAGSPPTAASLPAPPAGAVRRGEGGEGAELADLADLRRRVLRLEREVSELRASMRNPLL